MSTSARVLAPSRPLPTGAIAVADQIVAILAPVAALALRRGEFAAIDEYLSYWLISIVSSTLCFWVFGVSRTIGRYFGWRDLAPLALSVLTAVASASFISFSLDRMESVSRSEPLLHAALLFVFLALVRSVARQIERSKGASRRHSSSGGDRVRQALIIGTSPLAELYLRMVDDSAGLTRKAIDVVGLVAEKNRHVGRTIRGRTVLGTLENIEEVLRRLSVHGVSVGLVVIAAEERFFSEEVRASLRRLESNGAQLLHLGQLFGDSLAEPATVDPRETALPELGTWPGKRAFDAILSASMLIVLSPVLALVCLVVLIDIGSPVIFWQIRPGFRGAATRFYKFKTMRDVGADGLVRSDSERVSIAGLFLRRTRLDELPQLVNILLGQMSLIGPRPLLERDLHEDGAARILMRPGVTGWAQVNGGKLVEAQDKMALDLWYAYHASPMLDLLILWRSVLTVLFGDHLNEKAIDDARAFIASQPGHRAIAGVLVRARLPLALV